MRLSLGCISFALATIAAAQDVSLQTVKRVFDEALVSVSPQFAPRVCVFVANILFITQVPGNLSLSFNPKALLEVTFPQATGRPITLHAGIHLPRNGKYYHDR